MKTELQIIQQLNWLLKKARARVLDTANALTVARDRANEAHVEVVRIKALIAELENNDED